MKHDTTGATISGTASTATATAQRWLVALLFLGTALNYVDRQVLALLKPTLSQEFGWNDQQFAHLGAAFQLTAAAALLVVGPLVDRLGVRRAYGGAVGIWSLAGAAHAFAVTLSQFLGARVVLAAAEAVNTPAVVKACAQYLPLAQRSRALGIINSAPNLGAILTPLLVPVARQGQLLDLALGQLQPFPGQRVGGQLAREQVLDLLVQLFRDVEGSATAAMNRLYSSVVEDFTARVVHERANE
jgi:sugar phosphate permease